MLYSQLKWLFVALFLTFPHPTLKVQKHRILKVQNTLKIRMLDFEEILSIYGALTVLTSTIQVKQ